MSELKQLGPLRKRLAWSVVDLPTRVSASLKLEGLKVTGTLNMHHSPLRWMYREHPRKILTGTNCPRNPEYDCFWLHKPKTERRSNSSSIQWQPKNASVRKSSAKESRVQAKRHNLLILSPWDVSGKSFCVSFFHHNKGIHREVWFSSFHNALIPEWDQEVRGSRRTISHQQEPKPHIVPTRQWNAFSS